MIELDDKLRAMAWDGVQIMEMSKAVGLSHDAVRKWFAVQPDVEVLRAHRKALADNRRTESVQKLVQKPQLPPSRRAKYSDHPLPAGLYAGSDIPRPDRDMYPKYKPEETWVFYQSSAADAAI